MLERVHVRFTSDFQQPRAAHGAQKIFFHVRQTLAGDGIARDQDEFHRWRDLVLVQPETFPEQPPGAVADDGTTDLFAGDHAEFQRFAVRKPVPVRDQAAEHQAFAFLPHAHKITVLGEPPIAAQAQARRAGAGRRRTLRRCAHKDQTGVRRLRPARRRRAMVAAPRLVLLRARKPCWRLRRIFDG